MTQSEIAQLSPPQRLALITQLWDSLQEDQVPVTESQREELDRRLDLLDSHHQDLVTWTALKREIEQRCPLPTTSDSPPWHG